MPKLFRLFLAPLTALLLSSPGISAQSPGTAQSTAQPSPTTQDDAVKAAERQKRFEAEKARIEAAGPSSSPSPTDTEPCQPLPTDLVMSPNFVNMFMPSAQRFGLLDRAGHNLTAVADWSVEDSSIAELTIGEDGTPVLTGKQTGKTRLTARVDSRSTEALINVIRPEDMTSGSINSAWLTPPPACSQPPTRVPPARSQFLQQSTLPKTPCAPPKNGLRISPNSGSMLVNNFQPFNLYDTRSNTLTTQAEWSVSDSSVAELTITNGVAYLTGKRPGTVRLEVRVDSRYAEASINVVTPEDVRYGAVRLGLQTNCDSPTLN